MILVYVFDFYIFLFSYKICHHFFNFYKLHCSLIFSKIYLFNSALNISNHYCNFCIYCNINEIKTFFYTCVKLYHNILHAVILVHFGRNNMIVSINNLWIFSYKLLKLLLIRDSILYLKKNKNMPTN